MNIRDKILAYLSQKVEASLDEIARVIREEKDEVEAVINRLRAEGLVTKKQKGLIRKKELITLTPSGLEEAKKAYEKLEDEARRVQKMIMSNDMSEVLQQDTFGILPLLAALSLIDLMLLENIIWFESNDSGSNSGDYY